MYGVNRVSYDGAGKTIAIIDAGDCPNLVSDLHTFSVKYGLPDTTLTVANQFGGPPGGDSLDGILGWSIESTLDVEWAHAIAPAANLLWVEALSASSTDLLTAVGFAVNSGADVISMSFGGSEFPGQTAIDGVFSSPTAFVASSGDSGSAGAPLFPATNPHVLAVGGTTLGLNPDGSRAYEVGWSGSGGGHSTIYVGRNSPDVSYDADPSTGVAIYCTSPNIDNVNGPAVIGGTSIGAPQWAGLIALADQTVPSRLTDLPTLIGSQPSEYFTDILSGSNGQFSCQVGYDLVTGYGSPVAQRIVPIGPQSYVTALYGGLLGRSPDQPGLDNWVDAISSGRLTEKQVAYCISVSYEADAYIVNNLYLALLHRQAEAGGLQNWIGVLQTQGINVVIYGIVTSPEYLSVHQTV